MPITPPEDMDWIAQDGNRGTDAAADGDSQRDDRLSESRPTPGSAEGEEDPETQSDSNVPRTDDDRR